MAHTRDIDGAMMVACIAFVLVMMRSISVCTFVFLSINLNFFRAAATQVYAKGPPSTTRSRNTQPRPAKRDDQTALPERRNSPTPNYGAPHSNKTHQTSSPPPPYSVSASTPDSKEFGPGSIVELYEDIMASDAKTIQVQQQTMSAQQEIIRSQTQMILKLRHVLEEQDRMIDELDAARGLRSRRPGLEAAPRSRSS